MASLFLPSKISSKLSSFLKPRRRKPPLKEEDEKQREGRWKQLPGFVLEKIIQHLKLSDSLQMSVVCKSWRSVLKQINIRTTQVPWLMLPLLKEDKKLTFFDLSESRFYNINLPKTVQESWCCGSSKGWLIMAKGSCSNPEISLFNPISGVQLQLPSLQTIPFFRDYEFCLRSPYNSAEFVNKIVLSSTNAENCVVAGIFGYGDFVALSRPGDKEWTIFELFKMSEDFDLFQDILFTSDGILHVLICSPNDDFPFHFSVHNLSIGDGDQTKVTLRVIPNGICSKESDVIWEVLDEYDDIIIARNFQFFSYLVESNGELLIVQRISDAIGADIEYIFDMALDYDEDDDINDTIDDDEDIIGQRISDAIGADIEYTFDMALDYDEDDDINDTTDDDDEDVMSDDDEDDGGDIYLYYQTGRFAVFKVENLGSDMRTRRLYNLGDRVLFISARSDSVSIESRNLDGWKKNCIFFLDDNCYSTQNHDPLVSRESGIFYLADGKIERCFPSTMKSSIHYRMSWF